MSTLLDLADNSSDSEDDVDYVPTTNISDMSDYDDEGVSSDEDLKEGKKVRKTTRKVRKIGKKESEDTAVEDTPVVDEKQKANDIWKSFLEEVKTETSSGICSEASSPLSSDSSKQKDNSHVSSVASSGSSPGKTSELLLEFAGEVVSVTDDGCLKPERNISLHSESFDNAKASSKKEAMPSAVSGVKRKGLDSVLNTIMGKQKKITTLEKTLIDWRSFKKEEGIDQELEKFNRGKMGYIERQRFLQRSDLRSFEVEKSMRLSRAKKK